ncbi:hypothetical protein, partial [Listeria monocytogenes]|uniref:hypothetical protein n=1 Tax=Listeria monocytogenes TaxID=1639 RepID=UPI003F5CF1AD
SLKSLFISQIIMYYENMGDSNTRGEKKINHTQKGKIDFTFFVFMLLTFNNSKNIKGFLYLEQQRINSSVIQHNNFKGA